MKVIIAGGGIGGLVTALMLHARGLDCEVFEQADQVREVGATRCRTRSRSLPRSVFGVNRAASMPATTCRNFPSTATDCRT